MNNNEVAAQPAGAGASSIPPTWQERVGAPKGADATQWTNVEDEMQAEIDDLRTYIDRQGAAPISGPGLAHSAASLVHSQGAAPAQAEPVGEVMTKPDNERGTLSWPRVVWKDGLFALPPVGTKLYATAPAPAGVARAEQRFLDQYYKAAASSKPEDWMDTALLAKQWSNEYRAAIQASANNTGSKG